MVIASIFYSCNKNEDLNSYKARSNWKDDALWLHYGNHATPEIVSIGSQIWTAKNLDVAVFQNGDLIQEATTAESWDAACAAGIPAWCYYDDDPENGKKYGKMYNWFAVNDPRGLAPEGWHIPSKGEWQILIDFLGGEKVAGMQMKTSRGWREDGNGFNTSGFTALPAGTRLSDFMGKGENCSWFSSTTAEYDATTAHCFYLDFSFSSSASRATIANEGLYVRCVKDQETANFEITWLNSSTTSWFLHPTYRRSEEFEPATSYLVCTKQK